MKANELRKDNLVKSIRHYGLITEIHSIMPTQLRLWCNPLALYDYAEIDPIPLDESWLMKAGAKHTYGQTYFIEKLKFTYEQNELSRFVRFHYSGKVACLQYVHQLQNLTFALTGTELTFKTEGE